MTVTEQRGAVAPEQPELCPACGQVLDDATWSWIFNDFVHRDCLIDCGEAW